MTLDFFINTFVLLFVVVDPIGLAPLFAALTTGADDHYRRRMAVRGVGLSAAMLLFFAVAGDLLLRALGIGLPAFRIAGGVLLFLLALDMVFGRTSGMRATLEERAEAERREDISVFPLAFPLIAGPGALTTVLLLVSGREDEPLIYGAILGVLAVVLLLTLVSLLSASWILHVLGETGTNVIRRLLGLILAALAVQFVLDGVTAGVN